MKNIFKRTLVLLLATFGMSQVAHATHCDPIFANDIGPAIGAANGQPSGSIQTYAGDCSGVSGCNDYFDLNMQNAAQFFATFCSSGGAAAWDTGLSVWGPNDPTLLAACNDDACGLASELAFAAPSTGVYRIRIGGFGGSSGAYTLAYSASAGSSLVGVRNAEPIPTVSRLGQLLMTLLLLVAGGIAVRKFRTE